ncbi:uncharacterized protein [Asterias amurensis]|uniref:uncharacterized protein n=1 Tax=Asterias amurensis TaxID=7602 RepID=UPI003AB317FA
MSSESNLARRQERYNISYTRGLQMDTSTESTDELATLMLDQLGKAILKPACTGRPSGPFWTKQQATVTACHGYRHPEFETHLGVIHWKPTQEHRRHGRSMSHSTSRGCCKRTQV